ncbi:MAG: hypothetical protein ACK42Y_08290 [Candidatus Thermochlorobacter sp.]
MTTEDKELLRHYLDLRAKASEIEEELEKLKPAVFDVVDEELRATGEKQVIFEDMSFQIQYRTTYEYSSEVKQLEEQLKEIKKREEKSGVAIIKSQIGFVRVSKAGSQNLTNYHGEEK